MTLPDLADRAAIAIGMELCNLTEDEAKRFAGCRWVDWHPRERVDWTDEPTDARAVVVTRSARIVRTTDGKVALDLRPLIEERKA